MQKITWVDKNELFPRVAEYLGNVEVLLDIGCGIRPQSLTIPKVHVCCEPFSQYVEKLQQFAASQTDRSYIIVKATWAEAIELFPEQSVDTVYIADVIEHLPKEDGEALLRKTERIARGKIAIFTPLGFMPQEHPDGVDAWGMDGGAWQEHKSGWLPEDFGDDWEIFVSRDFHGTDSMGVALENPFGAFWAVKDNGKGRVHPDAVKQAKAREMNAAGELLYAQGNLAGAMQAFLHAVEYAPADAAPYINMGVVASDWGADVVSMELFKRTLEVDPRNVDAMLNAILVLIKIGHLDDARSLLPLFLQIRPENEQLKTLARDLGI